MSKLLRCLNSLASEVRLLAVCLGTLGLVVGATACGWRTTSEPYHVSYAALTGATRIDVVGRGNKVIDTIEDVPAVKQAVQFIQGREVGWIESWRGPRSPTLLLRFYRDDLYVGDFGIAKTYITSGGLYQDMPEESIAAFAAGLGIRWPSLL